jgi:hypothetical protein
MNLKSFHLFFILASALLSVGVGVWGLGRFFEAGEGGGLALGLVFLGLAVLLSFYGLRFRKKFKDLGAEDD